MKLSKLTPNAQGAFWTFLSAIFFVAMTVFVRQLGKNTSVPTMIFWRALAGLVASIPLVIGKPASIWKISRPLPFLFRVSTSAAAFFASFYAFANLPIAQAQSISFSRTLFITVLAVIFLGEKVAWRRWSAVFIGFVGVLLMSRAENSVFNLATISAIGAAALYALSIIMIKELTKDHDPATLVMYANIFTTLVGLPFFFLGGATPDVTQMIILLIMGFCGVGAQICYVKALSIGDASVMGIVDYSRLPMSALAGFIVFHETLDNITLLGAALVIGATIYITLREAKLGQIKPINE